MKSSPPLIDFRNPAQMTALERRREITMLIARGLGRYSQQPLMGPASCQALPTPSRRRTPQTTTLTTYSSESLSCGVDRNVGP